MIISVLSGKGGTGKTTVAVNFAFSLAAKGGDGVLLLDADVEEPNAGLYLKPTLEEVVPVSVPVPEVAKERCNYCGICADFCQFNALAIIPGAILTFPELCHGCGGCSLVCPVEAIQEKPREIGRVEKGRADFLEIWQGCLNVGEAPPVPVTRKLKEGLPRQKGKIIIIDVPPGASCPVVEAIRGSDYAILVTEPTPFGRHDLEIAFQLVQQLGIPHGVILNRAGTEDRAEADNIIEELCSTYKVPILLKIPFSPHLAALGAKGVLFSKVIPYWQEQFSQILSKIKERCSCANS